LLKGFDAGLSIEHLAARLQRGQNAVDVRLCKLGRGINNVPGSGANKPLQQTGPA
jgi:hypothetical protein